MYTINSVKKSGKEIEGDELREYRELAKVLFSINLDKLPENSKALIEVKNEVKSEISHKVINEEINDE